MRYEGLREMTVEVTRQPGRDPKVAVFNGTKFATSTLLTDRILAMFQQPTWPDLPAHTARWLALQREVSRLPEPDRLLVESFPHDGREHLVRLRLRRPQRPADARPSADQADGGSRALPPSASSPPTMPP